MGSKVSPVVGSPIQTQKNHKACWSEGGWGGGFCMCVCPCTHTNAEQRGGPRPKQLIVTPSCDTLTIPTPFVACSSPLIGRQLNAISALTKRMSERLVPQHVSVSLLRVLLSERTTALKKIKIKRRPSPARPPLLPARASNGVRGY